MKKINFIALGLVLPLWSTVCMGQSRTCDLEITGFSSPVKEVAIAYGEKFLFTATIKNNGPDDIKAGDTLIYLTAVSPEEPLGGILDKGIAKGESIEYTFYELTNENTTGETQVYDEFCAMLLDPHRFYDKPSFIDPVEDNNKNCASFTLNAQETANSIRGYAANLQLSIYPNPATDKISISMKSFKEEVSSIRLIDISGRQVMLKEAWELNPTADNSVLLDVSGISAGTYLVEVQSEGEKAITKVVLLDN